MIFVSLAMTASLLQLTRRGAKRQGSPGFAPGSAPPVSCVGDRLWGRRCSRRRGSRSGSFSPTPPAPYHAYAYPRSPSNRVLARMPAGTSDREVAASGELPVNPWTRERSYRRMNIASGTLPPAPSGHPESSAGRTSRAPCANADVSRWKTMIFARGLDDCSLTLPRGSA